MQISNIEKNWAQAEQIQFFPIGFNKKIYANFLYFVLSKFAFFIKFTFLWIKDKKNLGFC